MARYLHTMYRITDPEQSRTFYELLGMESRRESPIVRDGELEATNYFFRVSGSGGGARVDAQPRRAHL
jgi:catechol 2,3-dioxygenase-like lactoylglutathione lyase family enzyme